LALQQLGRRGGIQRPELKDRQPSIVERDRVAVPDRREQRDGLGLRTPRDERQHREAGAIKPVGVIDHHDQGRGVGRVAAS
jgi:hypothetical protein